MTPDIRPLVAGNWKMNGTAAALGEIEAIAAGADALADAVDVLVCPPALLVERAASRFGAGALLIGGQNCHEEAAGAFTGEISAPMLADGGARFVILGHSERRALFGEGDDLVRRKTLAAWAAGLAAIVCVGETEAEKRDGRTLDVIGRQIAASVPDGANAATTVIAYEPVWAIGTGLTPTADDVAAAHRSMRALIERRFDGDGGRMRLLYGGSVKAANAAELMAVANVDGALVGGASLKAKDFLAIAEACRGLPA